MKTFLGFLTAAALAAGAAFGDVPCQKCTHDMQVQYRECLKSGRPQATCVNEEQDAARKCVTVCSINKLPPSAAERPEAQPRQPQL